MSLLYPKYPEMQLSITHYNSKLIMEIPRDSSIDEVLNAMKVLLYGIGYTTDAVENLILDQADEIREIRQLTNHKMED